MEALSRVKELFPNLADISPREIVALFERFDERTRDDAGSSENLPKGCGLAWHALHPGGGRGGLGGHGGLGGTCRLHGRAQQQLRTFRVCGFAQARVVSQSKTIRLGLCMHSELRPHSLLYT